MSRRLYWLVVPLCLILIVSTAAAQEPLPQTFTSVDGSLTLNYPAAWVAQEVDPTMIQLANSQAAMNTFDDFENAQPGMVAVALLKSIFDLPDLPPTITPDLPPLDIATLLGQDLANEISGSQVALTPPVSLTLNGKSAAQMEATGLTENLHILMIIIDTGDATSLFVAAAPPGELQGHIDTLQAIAGTIQVSTPSPSQPGPGGKATPATTGNTISYGQTLSATLSNSNGDNWTFNAQAGDVVSITMTGDFDTYLELYDAANNMLTSDDDSAGDLNARIRAFTIPQAGTFTINARSLNNETGLAYNLTLERVTLTTVGPLSYNETVSASLTSPDGDRWTLQGTAGDTISIKMEADFDNVLELLDPANDFVTSDDDSGGFGNALLVAELTTTGTYTVVARAYSSDTGPYTLHLERLTIVTRGTLNYGELISTEMVNALGDRWTFTGAMGDVISIAMMADFDTYLELLDASGSILAENDIGLGYGNSLIDGFAIPADGQYTIVARSFGNQVGRYALMIGLTRSEESSGSVGR